MGKETEGTWCGRERYRSLSQRCGTLTNLPGQPNLALGLHAEVVVAETLAVAAGLALVLVAAGDATTTLVTTRRRRGRF